jgi:hypothetical protein
VQLGKDVVDGNSMSQFVFALPNNTAPLTVNAPVVVPKFATLAMVTVVAAVQAINGTANDDYLKLNITGPVSIPYGPVSTNVIAGRAGFLTATQVQRIPVTGGDTLHFAAQAYTTSAAGFPSNTANYLSVNATVLFQY